MSKEEKNEMVPKLRFKQSDGQIFPNWEEIRLNALAKLQANKNKGDDISRVLTKSASDGIVDQRDYFDKDIANKSNLDGYYIVNEGDYVYNPRVSIVAPVGPVSKNKVGRGVMSPLYTVFKFDNVDNDFFTQYFKTSHWYKYLRSVSNSGARYDRMSITPTVFMEMPVPNPHPVEQKKIADCLSSLDEYITDESQQLEALKTHKKGLMQQLFPAKGETAPQLRFAEFRDIGEWRTFHLEDIAQFFSGGTPSKDNPAYWNGTIPWISAASLHNYKIETSDLCITELSKSEGAQMASKGSVLILVRGSMLYKRIPMGIAIRDVAFNQDVKALKLTSDVYNYFLMFQLIALENKLLNAVTATGIGAGKLDTSDLKQLPVLIPSLTEQQKIANCLSSLDALIAAQAEKMEALKRHKQGLMQGLFPLMPESI